MTPNIENIDRIISLLEKLPEERFNMYTHGTFGQPYHFQGTAEEECGTACCVCGWINYLRITQDLSVHFHDIVEGELSNNSAAADWLGVPVKAANEIFYNDLHKSKEQAILELERLKTKKYYPVLEGYEEGV